MAKQQTDGGRSPKKLSKEDRALVQGMRRLGAVDKKPAAKKTAAKDAKKVIVKAFPESGKPSNAAKVVARAKTTAREARDVVTAVGTIAKRPGAKSVKNAVKQVAETAKAATTGKKGTTSDYVGQAKGLGLLAQGGESSKYYRKGTKR